MDRIDIFRIFTRVVETSSFTRAADTLNIPRSTVSTAIQELETRVGVRLLARTTRHVTTTTDGATFYSHCMPLLQEVEDIETLFQHDDAEVQGTLRVNVPSRIGRLIIAPNLPEFLDRYPGMKIELEITDRPVNLIEERLDCVLRVGFLEDTNLIGRKIGALSFINVASPSYLEKFGIPEKPTDLHHHLMVRYASPSTGRIEAWEWVEGTKSHTISMEGRVTVNSAETSIACCLAGLGLIQIPKYDVAAQLLSGDLIEVMPDWRPESLPVTLLYPHRKHLSRRLNAFMLWVTDIFKNYLN